MGEIFPCFKNCIVPESVWAHTFKGVWAREYFQGGGTGKTLYRAGDIGAA